MNVFDVLTYIENDGSQIDSETKSGLDKYKNQEYREAFALLKNRSDKGDKYARFALANMYLEGHGTVRDVDNALLLYDKAAEQGFQASKRAYVDVFFSEGKGIIRPGFSLAPQDLQTLQKTRKPFDYLEQVCDEGDINAKIYYVRKVLEYEKITDGSRMLPDPRHTLGKCLTYIKELKKHPGNPLHDVSDEEIKELEKRREFYYFTVSRTHKEINPKVKMVCVIAESILLILACLYLFAWMNHFFDSPYIGYLIVVISGIFHFIGGLFSTPGFTKICRRGALLVCLMFILFQASILWRNGQSLYYGIWIWLEIGIFSFWLPPLLGIAVKGRYDRWKFRKTNA